METGKVFVDSDVKESVAESAPKVSVGLPTYNRAGELRRAIASVLAQGYQNLELLISDDASTDETEMLCREFAARDRRVCYVRQPVNIGLTANNMFVFDNTYGEFFLLLSDDDWLEPNYVSACLRLMDEHPECASARGVSRYFREGRFFFENEVELTQESGAERVLAFLKNVGRNATLYGLMRRKRVSQVSMPNAIGGDWVFVAAVAFTGKIRVADGAFINRSVGGNSEDLTRLTRTLRLPRYHALNPYLAASLTLFKEIGWRSPSYRELSRLARLKLGAQAFAVVFARHAWPYTRNQLRASARLLRRALASPGKVWKRLRTSVR